MAVDVTPSTLNGGVTPACSDCGVHLCWDLSEEEYAADRPFWDAWKCEKCNGGTPMSLKVHREKKRARAQ